MGESRKRKGHGKEWRSRGRRSEPCNLLLFFSVFMFPPVDHPIMGIERKAKSRKGKVGIDEMVRESHHVRIKI